MNWGMFIRWTVLEPVTGALEWSAGVASGVCLFFIWN